MRFEDPFGGISFFGKCIFHGVQLQCVYIYIYIYMYLNIYIYVYMYMYIYIYIYAVQGQRGPKRGFPTLRCDAPGGGWRCDAATLRRSGGRVALGRCDAAVGPVTLRRCWRCDAATLE